MQTQEAVTRLRPIGFMDHNYLVNDYEGNEGEITWNDTNVHGMYDFVQNYYIKNQ